MIRHNSRTAIQAAVTLAVAAICATASADLVAHWNFNSGSLGTPWPATVASDSGSANLTHTFDIAAGDGGTDSYVGTTLNAVGADPDVRDFTIIGDDANGKTWTLEFSSLHYENVIITYASRGTAGGFQPTIAVDYSIDGGVGWTSYGTVDTVNVGTWELRTVDLSAIGDTDNALDLRVRFTMDGATADGGVNRFDNIQINATALDPIAHWNFNSGSLGTPWPATVPSDSGNANLTHTFDIVAGDGGTDSYVGTTLNAVGADPDVRDFTIIGDDANGETWTLEFSSQGWQDVVISYASRGTAGGFKPTIAVDYSTDGGVGWTSYGAVDTVNAGSWELRTVDLSAIDDTDNVLDLRVRFAMDGATASGGVNRFDNVQIRGRAFPGLTVTSWEKY